MKKISLDPMPLLREVAEERANAHFNSLAAGYAQQDQEHKRKREIAQDVIENGGQSAPEAFQAEAQLMGLSVEELASVIAGKPDAVLERGLQRRALVLSIRSATSPAQITALLEGAGIPKKGF